MPAAVVIIILQHTHTVAVVLAITVVPLMEQQTPEAVVAVAVPVDQ